MNFNNIGSSSFTYNKNFSVKCVCFIKYNKLKSLRLYYVMIIVYLNARNVLKLTGNHESHARSQGVSVQ